MKKQDDDEFAFSKRNNFDSIAIFELGQIATLPYCLVQVSDTGWVFLNRDYHVLPEGTHRLEEVAEARVYNFELDPRLWRGVWTTVTDRALYIWDSQFEEAADFAERLQRFRAYQRGCPGRV
jgi:hypothetical protein